VDAETGEGLVGASVRAAYFGPGGMGERVDLTTGQHGWAAITEPQDPEKDRGPNVFVRKEGYVPKAVGASRDLPDEYTMKLERALSAGGVIINEAGDPVSGVAIRIQRADDYRSGEENVDFQLAIATSDPDGRWVYSYIPKDYEELRFTLTHGDYAVTLPVVPAAGVDLMNLTLIMERGHTVTGRVTDDLGNPIIGADVREVTSVGYRRLSTRTDDSGRFTMAGVWVQYERFLSRASEVSINGIPAFRGRLEGHGQAEVEIAVQAKGYRSEARRIRLAGSTTVADFVLSEGHLFRGRVVCESGRPLAGAVVRTDTGNQGRRFHWQTVTDANGWFEWDSAPAEPVLFWFEAKGYAPLRDVLLSADGTEHEIRLSERRDATLQD
jgi:hypothetical protein